VQGASRPWLVAEDERVLGFAYAGRWRGRCAYRFSAEITVYMDERATGRGLGSRLLTELFERLRAAGMHSVLAGIALPNEASVALHEKMGMEKVAHFGQVGFKLGRWIDVGYWQRTF
jgi:phosphinothricin acetyltransferase